MRTVLGQLCAHNALTPQHVRYTDSFCQLPLSFHYCLTSLFSSVTTMLSGPVLLPCFRATEESERRQRSTRIRLLIASRNRVIWRGLCFLAGGNRRDRDVSRGAQPLSNYTHICYQQSAQCPWNGEMLGRTLPVNVIHCPFSFPCATVCHRWIAEMPHRHKHVYTEYKRT